MPNIVGTKVKYKEKWVRHFGPSDVYPYKEEDFLHGEQDVMLEVVRMENASPIIHFEVAHPLCPNTEFSGERKFFNAGKDAFTPDEWKVALISSLKGFEDVDYTHLVEISPDGEVAWASGYGPTQGE